MVQVTVQITRLAIANPLVNRLMLQLTHHLTMGNDRQGSCLQGCITSCFEGRYPEYKSVAELIT
jgi:hypothetical protein